MAQTQEFRGVARCIYRTPEGVRQFLYHSTAVVAVHPDGSIVLDSGGWETATTKTAMNQASNQAGLGFHVYARARQWFVSWRGTELEFTDGMRLQ